MTPSYASTSLAKDSKSKVDSETEEDTTFISVEDALDEDSFSYPLRRVPTSFVAMEFNHANESPGSICAVGVTVVEHGRIVSSARHLVKPYNQLLAFDPKQSARHGITFDDVESSPSLHEVMKDIYKVSDSSKLVVFDARDKADMLEEAFSAGRRVPRNISLRCLFEMAMDSEELKINTLHSLARGLSIAARDITDPLKEAEDYLVASMSQKVSSPTNLAKALSMIPPVTGDVASESMTVAELYLSLFEDERQSRKFDCQVYGRADKRSNKVSLYTVFKDS